ncbi:stage III sporulation protein AE [Hydrogenispora ethanolica]|uniref:Stage III sporulation protein AE n=1 Tax=Hydrogenispora ethanolica TaxID=1082276 RepID=A0A4R1RVU6_HYDET|nr:stage III sporulation protein AE [Hydrogenispora ethanolica]TCL70793.1 stage III sporulation protein AE [Hydrogenispora ethanolica]
MRAILRISCLALLLLLWVAVPVRAAEANPFAAQVPSVDLSELHRFLDHLDQDVQRLLPRLDMAAWQVTGPDWDWRRIGRDILNFFLKELVFNLKVLGELIFVALVLAILQNLRHAFEEENIGRLAFAICFLVVMGIVFNSFRVTFGVARTAIGEMSNFMYALIPVLFSLMVAGGGVTTATIVHPLMVGSVEVVAGLVNGVVFPLILFAGILGLTNYLFEGFELKKLANLIKMSALGLLGLAMAVFIGIVTIKGFAGSVADSTALRTAKYLSNTFLPVVGGELADTMEMAMGCSTVLKGGLGLFGLGVVVVITVFPLLKILAVAALYYLSGAIMQPLGNQRLADALETVGGVFLNIFGAVAVVGLMFYIAIAILVGMAGLRVG